MEEAAAYIAPSRAQLHRLTAPMAIVAAADDPVHPLDIGLEWAAAAPHTALRTVTLDQMGAEPTVLGSACLAALAAI
jgi:pimeloyl-ACP methyl ester carboxylesterase